MYEDDQEEPESVFDQRYSELTEEERDLKKEARSKSRDLDESVYTADTSYGTTSFEGTRDVKDFYKDAIQGATSTKEKRKLKEEETIYKAQPEPQTQDIRVTKETVGREAMMKEEEDLVGNELKKSMLSTRPYVRS